jgi:hypothetical protein
MSNKLILKDCSRFSDERVKGINISKNNFVSTDSLLQNKGGGHIPFISKRPTNKCKLLYKALFLVK